MHNFFILFYLTIPDAVYTECMYTSSCISAKMGKILGHKIFIISSSNECSMFCDKNHGWEKNIY